jgi:hypothetical protein
MADRLERVDQGCDCLLQYRDVRKADVDGLVRAGANGRVVLAVLVEIRDGVVDARYTCTIGPWTMATYRLA